MAVEETEFVTLRAQNGSHAEMAGSVLTEASGFNPDAIFNQLEHALYDDQAFNVIC